ncbi:MAG TPA: acyltransferase [Actinomycetota bacterium]
MSIVAPRRPADALVQVEAAAPARTRRPHLDAVDVVRVAMIAGVLAVHVVAYTTNPEDLVVGAANAFLHVNREVFFFLTAFVLCYTYGSRHGWSLTSFWKKRYLFVGVPYLAWSVLYFLADGGPYRPWSAPAQRLLEDLLAGTARYHLYFLLVTMEIYALFPLLLWLLRATRRHHGLLLAASLAVQTAFTATLHYARDAALHAPGLLGAWMRHPDPVVFSYQLYLVAGGIAALHLEELAAWVRAHRGLVNLLVAGGLAAGLASYVLDHAAAGMDAEAAGEVFQPMIAVTTAASVLGLFALGVRWADRGPQRRFRWAVRTASDATFGVYLAHPLLLQGLLILAAPLVSRTVSGEVPSALVLPLDLAVVVPVLLAASVAVVAWTRRTPASLFVAGRARVRDRGGAP